MFHLILSTMKLKRKSDALPFSVGVPQDSILGPLLYYSNHDWPLELPPGVNSTMFADDTTILVREPSKTVFTWADNNRMSLNITKIKSLLIKTRQKRSTLTIAALIV